MAVYAHLLLSEREHFAKLPGNFLHLVINNVTKLNMADLYQCTNNGYPVHKLHDSFFYFTKSWKYITLRPHFMCENNLPAQPFLCELPQVGTVHHLLWLSKFPNLCPA